MSQRLIPTGERFRLQTHIAMMANASLCGFMKQHVVDLSPIKSFLRFA